MVTTWRFLKRFFRVETLRRGSLTLLIASALRSCRMRLDRVRSHKGRRTPAATEAFADGPPAIVRVEHASRPAEQAKQLGMLTAEDVTWTLQAVTEPLRALVSSSGAETAPRVPYGAVGDRAVARVSITPGFEIQVREPVMFTVSLKEAGVEKARVEAKA